MTAMPQVRKLFDKLRLRDKSASVDRSSAGSSGAVEVGERVEVCSTSYSMFLVRGPKFADK